MVALCYLRYWVNSKEIENVGELVSGLRSYPNTTVSSGVLMDVDPFWSEVISEASNSSTLSFQQMSTCINTYSSFVRFPSFVCNNLPKSELNKLLESNRVIIDAIAGVSGKQNVLDASKEFTRGYYLLKHTEDAKVLFLVRDLPAVLNSTKKRLDMGEGLRFRGKNYKGAGANFILIFAAALFWLIGNLIGEFILRCFPLRVMRVKYESFCESSLTNLEQIGEFLSVNLGDVSDAVKVGADMNVGRGVGGNRLRFENKFRFDPGRGEVKPASFYIRILSVFAWPLKVWSKFYR